MQPEQIQSDSSKKKWIIIDGFLSIQVQIYLQKKEFVCKILTRNCFICNTKQIFKTEKSFLKIYPKLKLWQPLKPGKKNQLNLKYKK